MPLLAYRAKQSTNTIGTGTLVLNAAETNARSFSAAFGASSRRILYMIQFATGYELGLGDFDGGSPGSLTRATVLASSNANALVTLAAGTKDVFAVFDPAARETISISATATLALADLGNAVVFTGSSAATINLPAVTTAPLGAGWFVINSGTAALTIDPNGAELVNGAATLVLQPGASAMLMRNAAAWSAAAMENATPEVDIASAATTDIGATTSRNVRITGTTTITGLGVAPNGVTRQLRFAAALTLTHNATSLILPGGANITTRAGDTATAISLASGIWFVAQYTRAAGGSGYIQIGPPQVISSAVAAVDFVLPSGFSSLIIQFDNVRLATDGSALLLRGSINGGSTFLAGTTYAWAATYNDNTASAVGISQAGVAQGQMSGAADNGISDVTIDGSYRFTVGSATRRAVFIGNASFYDNTLSTVVRWNGTVWCSGGAALNAIRLLASAGNISSGTFTLMGLPQ